ALLCPAMLKYAQAIASLKVNAKYPAVAAAIAQLQPGASGSTSTPENLTLFASVLRVCDVLSVRWAAVGEGQSVEVTVSELAAETGLSSDEAEEGFELAVTGGLVTG
ncbi:hypothetical protein KIPB_015434, partial [Kipferlia bialata]